MGEHPPEQIPAPPPQGMGEAVPYQRVQSGIAEQHFKRGPGGGIALAIGVYRFTQKYEGHATFPL
jgi:hypothetical protein